MNTNLLNCISYIRMGQSEVLKSPDQAAVVNRVRDEGAVSSGDLSASVDRCGPCGCRVTIRHTNML